MTFLLPLVFLTLLNLHDALVVPRPSYDSSNKLVFDDDYELTKIGRQQFAQYFNFPLDDWQLRAGGAICNDCHVIVTAPTGAGKTVVGEMALLHAFYKLQRKGIYTTPLKALSNQKYTDLIPMFGKAQVGLSTGDISINKQNARATVMTTEVFRNLAWRATEELQDTAVVVLDEFHYMGYPGRGGVWEESVITAPRHIQIVALSATLTNAEALARWMEYVTQRKTVLVQVPGSERPVPLRYLFASRDGLYPLFRDADAGPGAPKGLLGLRGDGVPSTTTATTKKSKKGFGDETPTVTKLPRGLEVNPALRKAAEKIMQRVNRAIDRQRAQQVMGQRGRGGDSYDDDFGIPRRPSRKLSQREERRERERLLRREMRKSVPSLLAVVQRLQQKELLPAIFFLFSRTGCDEAARTIYQQMMGPRDPNRLMREEMEDLWEEVDKPKRKTRQRGRRRDDDLIEDNDGRVYRPKSNYVSEEVLSSLYGPTELLSEDDFDDSTPLSSENWDFYAKAGLLSYSEIKEVASRVSKFNEENTEIAFDDELVEQFLFGVGSHHAGMLPAHKSFVEVLYRNQLMKVVFATETLAAGINMPARTCVICALAKRGDGSSMNLLETSNLLQMAGRAGRRGMDTDGTCVIVATPFENHDDAAKILTDPVKPITSQFSPSYSLAVNLIDRGEGKLDIARQLVGKSFAMWEKSQARETVDDAIESHGENVSELLQTTAQERFVNTLVDVLQMQVEKRRATFNIGRIESLLETLTDRELLKKTSKSYVGSVKMLELETTTLGYLEQELKALQEMASPDDKEILGELMSEDEKDLLEQIEIQRKRTASTEKEVSKHPFSSIVSIANEIMQADFPESTVLRDALTSARQGDETPPSIDLTAEELSKFAKSAIVARRKTRKLINASPGLDAEALVEKAIEAEGEQNDSWTDMLSIVKTLVAYGCLTTEDGLIDVNDADLEQQNFTLTQAGVNVAMLGFENSLWCLAAIGGAWDVVSATSKLDDFRESIGEDDTDWYEPVSQESDLPKPAEEAQELVSLLRTMTPSEMAGYVSCLVSEGPRIGSISVVDVFRGLPPTQQRVIQSALLAMERFTEVQRSYSVDESSSRCTLDVTNCEVVTAWAAGCSWSDALQISQSTPGDLARTLSRALDALRQLGNLPYNPVRRDDFRGIPRGIHPEVRRLCRDAAQLINRYPLKDPLAFETGEDGEEEDFDDDDEEESVDVTDDE